MTVKIKNKSQTVEYLDKIGLPLMCSRKRFTFTQLVPNKRKGPNKRGGWNFSFIT